MKSKEALTEALTEQYGRMVHEYGTRTPHIVLRRALCEGMPAPWQKKFIALMEEYDDYYDHENVEFQVAIRGVSASGKKGVFLKDPYADLDNIPKLPYKK